MIYQKRKYNNNCILCSRFFQYFESCFSILYRKTSAKSRKKKYVHEVLTLICSQFLYFVTHFIIKIDLFLTKFYFKTRLKRFFLLFPPSPLLFPSPFLTKVWWWWRNKQRFMTKVINHAWSKTIVIFLNAIFF